MNAAEAISAVAEHVRAGGLTYPTERLVADRSDAGWSVYAPTVVDGTASTNAQDVSAGYVGFLVSDSGTIEQASAISSETEHRPIVEEDRSVKASSSLSSNSPEFMHEFGRTSEAAGPAVANSLDVLGDPTDDVGGEVDGEEDITA